MRAPNDSSAPLEDALPVFLEPSQVEAPAAPTAPIRPAYPEPARLAGREGTVLLRVRVRADGGLAGMELLQSDGEDFSRAAAEAVRAVAFRPATLRGEPVASSLVLRVEFTLAD